jgi:hypothetical protein
MAVSLRNHLDVPEVSVWQHTSRTPALRVMVSTYFDLTPKS